MKKSRISILHKALIAIAFILFPIFFAFIINYQRSQSNLNEEILKDLTIIAETFEGEVYQFLEMGKIRAEDFASDGFIREELQSIINGKNVDPVRLNTHLIKNKKTLSSSIQSICVIDLSGRVIASTDKSLIGGDVSRMNYFIAGKESASVREMMTVDMENVARVDKSSGNINIFDKRHGIAVSTPITNKKSGELIGVLVNTISLQDMTKLLNGEFNKGFGALTWQKGGREGMEVYIVNREKMIIAESAGIEKAFLEKNIDTVPVSKCIDSNTEHTGFYENYRGVLVGGASMCIPSMRWTVLVELNNHEISIPLSRMRRDAIAVMLIVLGLIVLFVIFFYKAGVLKLRRIAEASEEIGQGNFDVSLPVTSRDEIGLLSESINLMAKQLGSSAKELRKIHDRHERAQRIAQLGHWTFYIEEDKLEWSDEVYRIFELDKKTFSATFDAFIRIVHPDDREVVKKAFEDSKVNYAPYDITHRVLLKDGRIKYVHEKGETLRGQDSKVTRTIGTVQDNTDIKIAEAQLNKLRMAIEQSVNIDIITDLEGRIEYVNNMFEKVMGYSREESLGQDLGQLLAYGETQQDVYKDLQTTIKAGEVWRGTMKNRKKTGDFCWCNILITPVRDDRGEMTNYLYVQEDVTAKKFAEDRIERLATYDDLTGLVNRSRFSELLNEWLAFDLSSVRNTTVLLLDIDQFRSINDIYGHAAGDIILRSLAMRLKKVVSDIDAEMPAVRNRESIIGRMGSDEFAVFLPNRDAAQGLLAAEEVRRSLIGIYNDNVPVRTSVSIGVTVYPEDGTTTKSLFTKADAALMRAKRQGGNRIRHYRAQDKDLEHMHSRLHDKERIQHALDNDRFEPWFQPIRSVADGVVHHYESLARMRSDDGKILQPSSFIETAEAFGLIGDIDKMMMEKSMGLQARMMKKGQPLTFAMNLSGKDMADESMISAIKDMIVRTGADPGHLLFEITETEAIYELGRATTFINALKDIGCKFALDDFGVGFTSFVYLKEMKVDYIKIDGYFIKNLENSANDQLFVRAIVDVAHGLGIKTVAEFVQNEESIALLKEYGVDYLQGYYIGVPSPDIL